MAADHFTLQSAVDPPVNNSKSDLSPTAVGPLYMWCTHPQIKISPSFIITLLSSINFFCNTHTIYSQMDIGFGGRIMLTEKKMCTACPDWYRSSQREPWWTFWGFLWRRFSHKMYLLTCLYMIYPSINMYFLHYHQCNIIIRNKYYIYKHIGINLRCITWVFPVPVFPTDELD